MSLNVDEVYNCIDTCVASQGTSHSDTLGHVILDFQDDCVGNLKVLDVKFLLQLTRRCLGPRVSIYDLRNALCNNERSFWREDTLAKLCNIQSMDIFREYVEAATTKLEVEGGDETVGITFELKPGYWKDWMSEWTRPDDDAGYSGITTPELEDTVIEWGRQCGTEFNRATGDHSIVNYRLGKVESDADESL